MDSDGFAGQRPSLTDAQAAARRFLQEALPDVHRVDVTRMARVESGDGTWAAEAVVWQPNVTIQALGLSTRRLVLDASTYVVRLDDRLNVIAYEAAEAERAL